ILFIGGLQISIADIIHKRYGKHVGILQYDAKTVAQVRFLNLVDVDSVVADFTISNIIEPVNQVGNRRFSCSGGAYERNLLAGLRVKGNIVQHRFFRYIGKVYIKEPNIALEAGIGNSAVIVGMLPSPDIGTLRAFFQLAFLIFLSVDQGNVSVIGFLLLIQQSEDPVSTGQ